MKDINVLVVDDCPEIRDVIKSFLKVIGVSATYECKDGLEALTVLNGRPEVGGPTIPEIHVILCNIHMPIMGGIDFLREIRRHDKLSKVPVIMISGDGTEEKILESIKSGADEFILKPCSLKTIEDKINTVLKKRCVKIPVQAANSQSASVHVSISNPLLDLPKKNLGFSPR